MQRNTIARNYSVSFHDILLFNDKSINIINLIMAYAIV